MNIGWGVLAGYMFVFWMLAILIVIRALAIIDAKDAEIKRMRDEELPEAFEAGKRWALANTDAVK